MPRADDDLTAIGAPPVVAVTPPATPAPAAVPDKPTVERRPSQPRSARKPKRLTWEQRHVHKKLWFDREQLAQVQARLDAEDEGRTVAALVKELFDDWLAREPEQG